MSDNPSPISHFRSEIHDMTATAEAVRGEMRGHVTTIVALAPGDSRKAAFAWAARILNIPFNRVRSMFYGDERLLVHAHEADKIRAYVQQARGIIEARAKYDAVRNAYLSLAAENPGLAYSAPPPLPRTKAYEIARTVVAVADGTAELVGGKGRGQ